MADQEPTDPTLSSKSPQFSNLNEEQKQSTLWFEKQKSQIQILANFKKSEAKDRLAELEKERKSIERAWNQGIIGVKQYGEALSQVTRSIQVAEQHAGTTFSKMWGIAGKAATNDIAKFGASLEQILTNASYIGIAMWALKMYDAQRMLRNWAVWNEKLFGHSGKKSGELFSTGLLTTTKPMLDKFAFITDQMRTRFMVASQASGMASIRGDKGGEAYAESVLNTANALLMIGRAFGITEDQMADYRSTFKDVLGKQEDQVKSFSETLVKKSIQMSIPPKMALSMTAKIVDQFKFLYKAGDDVLKVMNKFAGVFGRIGEGPGLRQTMEATQETFNALGSLGMDKISGLIALAKPEVLQNGTMATALVDFYSKSKSNSRYDLFAKGYRNLQSNFMTPGATGETASMNKLAGASFIQSFLGVRPEIAFRIQEMLAEKLSGEKEMSGDELQKMMTDMMGAVTPIEEQFMNYVTNCLTTIVKYIMMISEKMNQTPETRELSELMQDQMAMWEESKKPSDEKGTRLLAISNEISKHEQNLKEIRKRDFEVRAGVAKADEMIGDAASSAAKLGKKVGIPESVTKTGVAVAVGGVERLADSSVVTVGLYPGLEDLLRLTLKQLTKTQSIGSKPENNPMDH